MECSYNMRVYDIVQLPYGDPPASTQPPDHSPPGSATVCSTIIPCPIYINSKGNLLYSHTHKFVGLQNYKKYKIVENLWEIPSYIQLLKA